MIVDVLDSGNIIFLWHYFNTYFGFLQVIFFEICQIYKILIEMTNKLYNILKIKAE